MHVQSRVATGTHQYTQQRRATEKRSASREQGLCARVCRAVACSVACCAMPRRDRPVVRPLSKSVSDTRCRTVSRINYWTDLCHLIPFSKGQSVLTTREKGEKEWS